MQIPANDMEHSLPAQTGFQLANLINRQPKNEAECKRAFQERLRRLAATNQPQDQNVDNCAPGGPLPSAPKAFQSRPAGSENLRPEKKAPSSAPGVSKTLKKVNVDYFRGKKVQFKHANVRISFEIVDSLF